MAENWFADVQKYAPDADPDTVAGIVKYCGIALRKRDSSLVSFSSPEEIARVRENFLKKKLGLTNSDTDLDKAISAVGTVMNRNPLPIVLPCHRVLGSNGSLTGYAGGLETKERLLRLEGALLYSTSL